MANMPVKCVIARSTLHETVQDTIQQFDCSVDDAALERSLAATLRSVALFMARLAPALVLVALPPLTATRAAVAAANTAYAKGSSQSASQDMVESMLSTGELPANLRSDASRESLYALARALDRQTFLEPQGALRQSYGVRALSKLLALSGPLPEGMPPGITHALVRYIEETSLPPNQRKISGGICTLAILADGPSRVALRLAELPTAAADAYGLELIQSIRGRLYENSGDGNPGQPVAGWSDAQLSAGLGTLAAWIEDRSAEMKEPGSLPAAAEDGISGVAGKLMFLALVAEKHPRLRVDAALASLRAFDALDDARERLGTPRVGPGLGWPLFAVFLALADLPGGGADLRQLRAIRLALDAIVNAPNDRIDERLVAVWIPTLEQVTIDFGQMQPGAFGSVPGTEELPQLIQSCVALISRFAALPHDHPAWKGPNRCAWLQAVDRHGPEKPCDAYPSLVSAWRAARAHIREEWRVECRTVAEHGAARADADRAQRQALRAAWDHSIKSGEYLRRLPPVPATEATTHSAPPVEPTNDPK